MSYRPNTVARLEFEEIELRYSRKNYRKDAYRRKRAWQLPDWLFRSIFNRACHYCGTLPARGIDRRNNTIGYKRDNAVPCCSKCNYAKRDLTEGEFLGWLRRLSTYQGFGK